jgi:hypothetical protein
MDADPALTDPLASHLARMVLAGIHREYPNKLDHVLNDNASLLPPRALHPALFGCFDWHSAVHGHWVLARLLRLRPTIPEANAIRDALSRSLTPQNIAAETAYLARPNSGSFERTYGWAWLLKLAAELHVADHPSWATALAPLAAAFVMRYLDYLPRAGYPIRSGVHANSAFGLAFAHDYAAATSHHELLAITASTVRTFFRADAAYPAHLEPSGADFFSPSLMEADLMRRILPPAEFADWFDSFLPQAAGGMPRSLFEPARVSDRTDLQIVHLDGLNLSRAWCMRNTAQALPAGHAARGTLTLAADRHLHASLPHVGSGHYGGDHWLATFALLAMTGDQP